nr:TIGR04255 family protein [Croceibacterium sp. D39]
MGIQFRTPDTYHQILAGEVWNLFRDRFPEVEEHQRLAPVFETFGPPTPHQAKFELLNSAQHDRFWFLTRDKSELVQFQDDRLLHNWRRLPEETAEYPRFENMAQTFQDSAEKLERYLKTLGENEGLEISQVEVSYINHFPVDREGAFTALVENIKIVDGPDVPPEDMSFKYRRVIENCDQPAGRLYVSCTPKVTQSGKRLVSLDLVVRGSPQESNIEGAMEFLFLGRDLIVREFANITTDGAQQRWGRTQ